MRPQLRNVLISGGAGYVGTLLAPQLLAAGYNVTVYDAMFYGCELQPQNRLKLVEGDIRDTTKLREALWGVDAMIQLACISNDPSFELNENLSKSINYDCFERWSLRPKSRACGAYLRLDSSVYGVSDAPEVREDHPLAADHAVQ